MKSSNMAPKTAVLSTLVLLLLATSAVVDGAKKKAKKKRPRKTKKQMPRAATGSVPLHSTSFDQQVHAAGVAALVRFYAEDRTIELDQAKERTLSLAWEELGTVYGAAPKILVGSVDCKLGTVGGVTGSNMDLCAQHVGVPPGSEGFRDPTVKFYHNGTHSIRRGKLSRLGDDITPANSITPETPFSQLLSIASAYLGAPCSDMERGACSPRELQLLRDLHAKGAEQRRALLAKAEETVQNATRHADTVGPRIQAQLDKVVREFASWKAQLTTTFEWRALRKIQSDSGVDLVRAARRAASAREEEAAWPKEKRRRPHGVPQRTRKDDPVVFSDAEAEAVAERELAKHEDIMVKAANASQRSER
jgi:hypothetical protein